MKNHAWLSKISYYKKGRSGNEVPEQISEIKLPILPYILTDSQFSRHGCSSPRVGLVCLLDLWKLEIFMYIESNQKNMFWSTSDRYQAVTVVKLVKVQDKTTEDKGSIGKTIDLNWSAGPLSSPPSPPCPTSPPSSPWPPPSPLSARVGAWSSPWSPWRPVADTTHRFFKVGKVLELEVKQKMF